MMMNEQFYYIRSSESNQTGNNKVLMWILFALAFFSPMGLIKVNSFSVYNILCILYLFLFFIQKKNTRVSLPRNYSILFLIVFLLLSTVLAFFWDNGGVWFKRALKGFIVFFIVVLVFSINDSQGEIEKINVYRKGLIWACHVNITWAFLQVICFTLTKFDLNSFVFGRLLHLANETTTFRGGIIMASGIHWHPGNLAPMLIIAFLLVDKLWYRMFVVIVTIFTFNSTAMIGMLLTIAFICLLEITGFLKKQGIKDDFSFKNSQLFMMMIIVAITMTVIGLLWKIGLFDKFSFIIQGVIRKITFSNNDTSAKTHLDYYINLFDVIKRSSVGQIVFGYGYGCSGYPFSAFYNQYTFLESWAVESDVINTIIGFGVFATFFFYLWLFKIAKSGNRINKKYAIIILVFVAMGFGYNIQSDWLILFEGMLMISIKKHVDFFAINKNSFLK